LNGRDPLEILAATPGRIRALTEHWTPAQFEPQLCPGQMDRPANPDSSGADGTGARHPRARMAQCTASYAAQGFDQKQWISRDAALSGADALNALVAISTMNRSLFQSLSAADGATPFTHPEYGAISVDWLIHQMAGHQIHHFEATRTNRGNVGDGGKGRSGRRTRKPALLPFPPILPRKRT
jgi:hypothetical protein